MIFDLQGVLGMFSDTNSAEINKLAELRNGRWRILADPGSLDILATYIQRSRSSRSPRLRRAFDERGHGVGKATFRQLSN